VKRIDGFPKVPLPGGFTPHILRTLRTNVLVNPGALNLSNISPFLLVHLNQPLRLPSLIKIRFINQISVNRLQLRKNVPLPLDPALSLRVKLAIILVVVQIDGGKSLVQHVPR